MLSAFDLWSFDDVTSNSARILAAVVSGSMLTPIAICRCGGSSNKPFSDGTYAAIDFDGTLAN